MSKILKRVSEQSNLICDTKRSIVYGNYQGYTVAVKENLSAAEINIIVAAKSPDGQTQQSSEQFISGVQSMIPLIKKSSINQNVILFTLKYVNSPKKIVPAIIAILNEATMYCRNSSLIPCCQYCGAETQTTVVSVDSSPSILCDNCFNEVVENIETTRSNIKTKKGNMFGGIVGAFIGSLIGVALWVIIYQLGYIAGIVGLVFAVCSLKGYEKLGGKLNIPGLIISLVIAVGMLYVAENIALAIEIFNAYKSQVDITFFDAFKSIPEFMQNKEISNAVLSDLIFGYILMAVASFTSVVHVFRQSNHIIEVTKLDSNTYNPEINASPVL